MAVLLERGVRYVAALKSDRFASIAQCFVRAFDSKGTPSGHGMVSEEKLRFIIGPGKRGLGRNLPFPIACRVPRSGYLHATFLQEATHHRTNECQ